MLAILCGDTVRFNGAPPSPTKRSQQNHTSIARRGTTHGHGVGARQDLAGLAVAAYSGVSGPWNSTSTGTRTTNPASEVTLSSVGMCRRAISVAR